MKKLLTILIGMTFGLSSNGQCIDSITVAHPTCPGYCDGAITVYLPAASGPFTVVIQDSEGNIVNLGGVPTVNLLCAGWYFIDVDNGMGCAELDSVEVIDPGAHDIQLTIINESSAAACDGSATVDTVLNYIGAYTSITYFWTPGGPGGLGENQKTDMCAGEYTITINDEVGCSKDSTFTIGTPAGIMDEINPTTQVSANLKQLKVTHDFAEPVQLKLYDISGKVVFSREIPGGNFEQTLDLHPGIYLYQVSAKDGSEKTGKLLIGY